MAKKEPIFPDGFIFKGPRQNAPEFIKASISIKVGQFIPFLEKHAKNGWVNLDVKKSQKGSIYVQLEDWKSSKDEAEQEELAKHDSDHKPLRADEPPPVEDISPEDIPF